MIWRHFTDEPSYNLVKGDFIFNNLNINQQLMRISIKNICSVDCSVSNGGCSNRCTNPTTVGRDVTCSCEGSALTIDPNGDKKQCGK